MTLGFKASELLALAVLILAAPLTPAVSAQGSPAEANKAIIRRFVDEAWNQGNFANLDSLVSPDTIVHHYLIGTLTGKDAVIGWIGYARSLVPDLRVTIERLVAEGDQVVMHWSSRGTYADPALSWPANQYSGSGLIVYVLKDGLIVEQWYSADSLLEAQGGQPSPQAPAAPDAARTDASKAVVSQALEFVNGHDLDTLDAHFSPTVAIHATSAQPLAVDYYGLDGARAYYEALFAAFPDLTYQADDVIAEDNLVMVRWTARGTFSGEYQGVSGGGQPVEVAGISLWRVADGKIAELWVSMDTLKLLQEMGIIPAAQ